MKRRIGSLLLAAAMLVGLIGAVPTFSVVALTTGFSFNFQNNDSAYENHAGYRTIAFPACGWMALNNISSSVVPRHEAVNVTVEVEYFWENATASGWVNCRANDEQGLDSTSVNERLGGSEATADKWSVWKIEYSGIYFGSREDNTDLFFSFGGTNNALYIRCIKVYVTGHPENVVLFEAMPVTSADDEVHYPYQDTSLSFEERAADLVSRMTTEEKLSQFGSNNVAIGRLGVRHYNYWRECLHGVARMHEDTSIKSNTATSFPYSISMGASWNPELIRAIGSATSDEARGFDNEYQVGLNYFSPTINLYRDPRWGRSNESYSEDAWLTSLIGEGFVNGLQGDDEVYKKVNATIKHYALNNSEYNREKGDSVADNRTVLEQYTRAFKYICLNTDISSVMSSYNRVNGVPSSANRYLLTDLLRERWGFGGFVVSDCGAVADIYQLDRHHWKPTADNMKDAAVSYDELSPFVTKQGYVTEQGAVALSLMAGLDLNCGFAFEGYLGQALEDGLVTIGDIDKALTRIFTSRFATGEFDPVENVPYASEEYSLENQQESEAHRRLAEDAADEGIVLLKNNGVLPLDASKTKNIVLVGENVNEVILGDYSGKSSDEYASTPAQGVTNLLKAQNPDANVTVIDTKSAAGNFQYFGNIGAVKVTYTDGSSVTLQPKDCIETIDCEVESPTNFGYVHSGGYAKFPAMRTKDIASIEVKTSGSTINDDGTPTRCSHGQVEVHLNAPDGILLTSIESTPTSGWGDYQAHTSTAIGSNGGYDNAPLYIVFNAGMTYEMTDADKEAIKNADAVIACVGTVSGDSGEGHDRQSLELPRSQAGFVKEMTKMNANTIAYLQTISLVNVESFKDDVTAMLWTSYNGQAQGNALARILFGDKNPSAKLPFTWYTRQSQLPDIADYTIRSNGSDCYGRTYQYFTGDVSYEFGYGLSYTSFEVSDVKLDKTAVTPNDTLNVTLNVKNTGSRDGAEVVQVYAVAPGADGINRPFKELKGFQKVSLAAGETKQITISMAVSDWYFCDEETGAQQYDAGNWTVQVGVSSKDIRAEQTVALSGSLTTALQSVFLNPTAVVLQDDATRGDTTLTARLTASLTDDTMLDLAADGVQVKYESNRPEVATVSADGVVTAVSGGVTTITASVTYKGKTITASYPVVVQGTAKLAQGSLTSGRYTVSGLLPVGGRLRPVELAADDKDPFFYNQFSKQLTKDGVCPAFFAFGFDIVWNYENQTTEEPYQMAVTLPEGTEVVRVHALDRDTLTLTDVTFTVQDGVLTFAANPSSFYALETTGKPIEPEKPIVKKDALKSALDAALADLSAYTAESAAAYEKALADARTVYADEKATQAAVDAAVKALADAKAALVVKSATIYGDVNHDGAVDTADAVLVLQRAAKLIGDGDLDGIAADVNGDKAIDTADAVLILQRAAKLIERFPAEA